MKNFLKKREVLVLILISIMGSISQPLLAYSYMLLGNFMNLDESGSLIKIVFLMILSFVGIGIYYFITVYIKNNIVVRLRCNKFKDIIEQDIVDILDKDHSEYINLINLKIDAWRDLYFTPLLFLLKDSLQILFMIVLLASISVKITLVVSIFILPLIVNNIFFPKLMKKRIDRYFTSQDRQLSAISDVMQGIVIVKNQGAESNFESRLNSVFEKTNSDTQSLDFLENISGFIANCGVALSQISGVVLSLIFLNNGEILLGQFLAMVQLTFFLNEPIISLINNCMKIISAKKLKSEIFIELAKNKNDEVKVVNLESSEMENNIEKLELSNLNFKYDKKFVFKKNLNFTFEKNKKYLIKGESGSGKSTLSRLLLKFNKNYSGNILLGDEFYNEIDSDYVNERISYINQEPYIFDMTLKENIDLKSRCSDEDVEKLIKDVKLDKLLIDLGGLDKKIDKTKRKVSGGEKARIAIARALTENKPIIIADEVLANLDEENSINIESLLLGLENVILINICHHHNEKLSSLYDGVLYL